MATTEASGDDVDDDESAVTPRAALQKVTACILTSIVSLAIVSLADEFLSLIPDWQEGYLANAKVILQRARKWKGTCKVRARYCYQVTCVEATAFSLCNDNYHDISPDCSYFATFAQDLIDKCTRYEDRWFLPTFRVGGQEFETAGYNMFITKEKYNCRRRP
ncbi:hypothetical protein DL98DRAFT_581523 [Cadophora sp. DSE1049]|nr:hypothetical protein DL98DRAFT_581523 [Cadophora sp. DSE1049]